MIFWLFGWIGGAAADNTGLISQLQSQSYQLNNKLVITSADSIVLKELKHADLQTESFPKLGDPAQEIERLLTKYPEHCLVHITPNESSEGPIKGFDIQEHGMCTVDPALRFTVSENGNQWTVLDHRKDPVSIQTFAMVCQDIALQTRLTFEDQMAAKQSRYLYYGAAGLTIGGLFMNGNPDPGFSAREENRFWTSVFLFGTAAMLYTQRDVPQIYRIDKQDDISHYYTKEKVQQLIDATFPPLSEDNEVVEESAPPIGDAAPSENIVAPLDDDAPSTNDTAATIDDSMTTDTETTDTAPNTAPSQAVESTSSSKASTVAPNDNPKEAGKDETDDEKVQTPESSP